MNKTEKFKNFLESLKGHGQDSLIESVSHGFQVCYESDEKFGDPYGKRWMHYITTTYQTVDEESAEHGDFADQGWVDEEGESMEPSQEDREERISAIGTTVRFLKDKGATQGSEEGSNAAPTSWSTDEPEHDRAFFEKGEHTTYTYHLNNYTDNQRAEIYKRMKS